MKSRSAVVSVVACVVLWAAAACGPSKGRPSDAAGAGGDGDTAGSDANTVCAPVCSSDLHQLLDCHGNVLQQCSDTDACDDGLHTCVNACAGAAASHSSVGCEYYATDMENEQPAYCFAAFVANTWTTPAHLSVDIGAAAQNVAAIARIPSGAGAAITYGGYDPVAGIPPGEVAVVFLSGIATGAGACPIPAALANASHTGTGMSTSFRISTDVPVVAYQINPYGGGAAAVTGASLLLPTSVWDTDYLAVTASPDGPASPSFNIVAATDGTVVTMNPKVAVISGGGITGGPANTPLSFTLNRGQSLQISQSQDLTGSPITATKPIGFLAGHRCMNIPSTSSFCDHAEQMLPPVHALGHRYVAVPYRPRLPAETTTMWRVIGAADGTTLTYSAALTGAPLTLAKGQSATFTTTAPFTVESQDADHPFILAAYMTSSGYLGSTYGDPDFVLSVPPEQYLARYVFFTDPTYPETNLVVVRKRGTDNQFHDVELDCAGVLGGWQAIGDFEWTRADLDTGNFAAVGACSTGRHVMKSDAPFGLWVWGWGTPLTTPDTSYVSYGYPGGMDVAAINQVIIQ